MKPLPRAQKVLADNLTRLEEGAESARQWALARGLDPKMVSRAKIAPDVKLGTTLQVIADKSGLQPWQLLHPDLNTGQIAKLSAMALDIAYALDRIEDPERKRKAYALMVQVVDFENPGSPD